MAYIGKRPVDTFPANNAVTASIISANAVGSSEIANSAVGVAELAADSVTGAKIADDAVNSEHYTDGSIDTAHIADAQITTAKITDVNVTTAKIADDAVTLAKLAGIARGKIIYGDASGNPAVLAPGTNGQVLKSDGTDVSWGTDTGLTTEEVQDIAGGMFSSNTETGITATYQDSDGTVDLVVGTLNQDTTGNAATATVATALETARTIGGTSFDGSANIAVGLAGTATTLATARTIHGVSFDGSANISLTEEIQDTVGAMLSSNTETGISGTYEDGDGTIDLVIGADQVVNSMIADDAIDSAQIADGSIDTAHIADDQVTAAKLANTAVTAASYGSSSAIPVLTVDAQGRITAATTAATSSTLTIAADSGSNDTVTVGTDTLTFAGTSNEVNTTVSNNQIQVGLPDNVTIGGNLTVTGNYTVNGTTTTVATSNMVVSDNLIELNNGASSNANDSGIVIERGSTGDNAIFVWDESADKFIVGTTTATGASTGDLTITTATLVGNLEGNVTGNTSGSSGSTTGNAATATALATARTIGGTSFDGTANIAVGLASTATALATARTIGGTSFDGTGNIAVGLAGTATALATARTIGGTSFDGTANIAVGLAGTATTLATARNIGGVSFDGSANINLPGVNAAGSQNTTGTAASWTTARTLSFTGDATGTGSVDGSANVATALSLAADSVDSAEIADGAIDTAHIADDQITQAKMADDAIGADQLAVNSVVSASIVNGSIVAADLADNSVTSAKIVNGTIASADIANNAILTQHIDDNQVTGDQIADDIVLSGTGAIRMPDGTTGQRPGSAAAGMFRYNTTTSKFEGYTDAWGDIGGGGSNTFSRNAFTGDGSDTTFTLSQTPDSENNLIVFIEGVFQDQDAYSVSGTTLTFGTAPVNGRGIIVYHVKSAVSGTNLSHFQETADGTDTQFTLSITPVHENNTMVYIDGVYQNKTSYTVSGTTLDFGSGNPPPASSKVECMTMNQLDINTPVDDTISTAKIQALAVTEAKIAVNAVTSLKIAENAITARELATNAIATLFIADNSVTSVKIAQNSILTKHIDDAQITTGHIIDANVTTAKIADNAVTAAKIGVDVLTDQVAGITSSATPGSACLTIDSNEHGTFANNLTVSGALAGASTTLTTSATDDPLSLVYTGAAANVGPVLKLYRNSGSPADSDALGEARFIGKNDASEDVNYAQILSYAEDVSNGTEDGAMYIKTMLAGTARNTVSLLPAAVVINDEGQDVDFRVEGSGNANALVVQGSDGNVGIGTAAPGSYGGVQSQLEVKTSGHGGIAVNVGATSLGQLQFAQNGTRRWGIECENSATPHLTFNEAGTQRMTIDAGGNVGIGTAAPDGKLHVFLSDASITPDADADDFIIEGNGASGMTIGSSASSVGSIRFADSGSPRAGMIYYNHVGNEMRFYTGATERVRINSAGHLGIGTSTFTTNANIKEAVVKSTVTDGVASYTLTTSDNSLGGCMRLTSYADANSLIFGIQDSYDEDGSSPPTERMRIKSDGNIVIGNTGTPAQVGKLNTSGGITQAAFYVGNTGFASKAMIIGVEGTGDNSGYNFAEYWSGRRFDNSSGDIEFKFRGDGNAYADASWNASGADYAEYFEWSDGNGSSQDRIGLSVVLDGNKIREATGSDAAGTIIGVISGNAAVVGDTSFDKWTSKYEKDDYGRYVHENYVDENGDTLKRRKLNASYDDSLTYVEREKRKEWDTVGLMGKLRMKKGQQTGTNWIKMRDISASVEEWLVR